jgi:hypothetical protein
VIIRAKVRIGRPDFSVEKTGDFFVISVKSRPENNKNKLIEVDGEI